MSRADAIVGLLRRPSAAWRLIGGVTTVNLLLAVVSFAKDLSFAAYFGTSREADLVNSAFLLPEAIGYNLIAGVVGIAAVPAFTRAWQEGRRSEFLHDALRLAAHITLLMLAIGAALALARGWVFELAGYAAGSEETRELERLYMLLLVTLPLFPLYAVGGAALQAAGAFYAAAAGPVLLNGLMLAALAASVLGGLPAATGATAYAASIVAGSGGMAVLVWTALRRRWRIVTNTSAPTGLREPIGSADSALTTATGRTTAEDARTARDRTSARHSLPGHGTGGLARVYRDFLPLLLLTLFSQAQYAAERTIASNLEPGTLAALNYAYRVSQFPNWVFVAAVTAVLLPSLSRTSGLQDPEQAARPELFRALRGTLLVMLPAAFLLFALRQPVVELLFGRGAFDAQSVSQTSGLLAGYSLGVVGQAVSGVLLRYLIARGRLYGPAAAYLTTAAVTVLFDLLAVREYGSEALGYGSLVGWTLNALLMFGFVLRDSNVRRG